MSMVTLPIRIRPNRLRMLFWAGVWSAVSIPAAWLCWQQASQIATLLTSPGLTWEFAASVLVILIIPAWLLIAAACILACLPRAPFFHIEVDDRAITERFFGWTNRRTHRDVESWQTREDVSVNYRTLVPILLFSYSVVAHPQGSDPQRRHRQARHLLEFDSSFFAPPFCNNAIFAQELADCLTAAVTGAKQSARPITIEISPRLFEQTFELQPRKPDATAWQAQSPANAKSKRKQARLPGRFPTNQDRYEHWWSQAIQSSKASDDNPYTQVASERAELYRQLAKRDRKRIARENRQRRLQKHAPGADTKTQ